MSDISAQIDKRTREGGTPTTLELAIGFEVLETLNKTQHFAVLEKVLQR